MRRTPADVECDELLPGEPGYSGPLHGHAQLHPLLHLHERWVRASESSVICDRITPESRKIPVYPMCKLSWENSFFCLVLREREEALKFKFGRNIFFGINFVNFVENYTYVSLCKILFGLSLSYHETILKVKQI